MTKFHWKTSDMIAALQAACPGKTVHNTGPGGDYDTDELVIEFHVEDGSIWGIYVSGFTPGDVMTNPSDTHVTHITLGDGMDSRGGLTTNNPDMVDAYCAVRKALAKMLQGTDVHVYNHYHEFF